MVLIEFAAESKELRAVVSDGATIRSFTDHRNAVGVDLAAPFAAVAFTAVRVLSGSSPGDPLEELIRRISPTPLLLIAAGRGIQGQREANHVYAEAAREPVELWDLPDVNHTAAIRERPTEYERKVVGFFDAALVER